MSNDSLAAQLRDFADRVEDGELDIVEMQLHADPPRVVLEGMNHDDLVRMRTVTEEDMRNE